MPSTTKTPLFGKWNGGDVVFADQSVSTGERIFVDDSGTDATGYGGSPNKPVATIDYAVGLCTAGRGDIIYVMPGHAEALTAATSLVVDIAGVSIIGLGSGRLIPKLSFTTAAGATISVTAANVTLKNLWLYSNFTNGITTGITFGAAADGGCVDGLIFEEAANTKEFLIAISVTAACHNMTIKNCRFYGVTGGTDSSCIVLAGASNFTEITDNIIYGDFSGAVIDASAAASTYLTIARNYIINDDAAAGLSISNNAASTGMVADNRIAQLKNDVAPTGDAMMFNENYVSNVAAVQGRLLPVVDT